MLIYYGNVAKHSDVSCANPVEAYLDEVLTVLESLDQRNGFLGLIQDERFTLQFLAEKDGTIRLEILDATNPGIESANTSFDFAAQLIRLVAFGKNAAETARQELSDWECIEL